MDKAAEKRWKEERDVGVASARPEQRMVRFKFLENDARNDAKKNDVFRSVDWSNKDSRMGRDAEGGGRGIRSGKLDVIGTLSKDVAYKREENKDIFDALFSRPRYRQKVKNGKEEIFLGLFSTWKASLLWQDA